MVEIILAEPACQVRLLTGDDLIRRGAGIAPLSRFLVSEDLRTGRLAALLPEYDCGSAGIYAVYQDRRYQQPKVRLFIELMNDRLPSLL